jgi:hypothetical protein
VSRSTRLGLLSLFFLFAPRLSSAQAVDERVQVRRAVLDYVEGFYEGDSTKHVRSVVPEVFKFGYWIPRDSTRYQGGQMTWPEFHAYTNRVKANKRFAPPTAPKEIVIFDVLDQTASAKLTASWGVDYLLLAKRDGRWMVSHVLWQTKPRS